MEIKNNIPLIPFFVLSGFDEITPIDAIKTQTISAIVTNQNNNSDRIDDASDDIPPVKPSRSGGSSASVNGISILKHTKNNDTHTKSLIMVVIVIYSI